VSGEQSEVALLVKDKGVFFNGLTIARPEALISGTRAWLAKKSVVVMVSSP